VHRLGEFILMIFLTNVRKTDELTEWPVEIYQSSAVAYIDILGFKNALGDKSKARGILDALHSVKTKIEEYYRDPLRKKFQGVFDVELTAFSDSVAISGAESQTIVVLFAALELSQLLVEKGFLCRGAITCGELFHKTGIIFGDAFVAAYRSENSQAIYPRIIVDNRTVTQVDDSKNSPNDFTGLIKIDKDGSKFLNLLYRPYDYGKHLKGVLENLVQQQMRDNVNSENVKQKLVWLKNEYRLSSGTEVL
jgi:hypothetical protein